MGEYHNAIKGDTRRTIAHMGGALFCSLSPRPVYLRCDLAGSVLFLLR